MVRSKTRKKAGDRDEEGVPKTKRVPRADASKLSEESLREAALRYLDRQDGSVEQVRRSLQRRIARFCEESTKAEALLATERVLTRLQDARILDDERFALGFAQGQRRRGGSTLYVRQKLVARGLPQLHIEAALESTNNDQEHNEEASAAIYVRKRRLTERYDLNDPAQRQKALATLARRGFSFEIARRALKL